MVKINVKERILSLRIIEKKESHLEFLGEIGVVAAMKENDRNQRNEEKTVVPRERNRE